MYDYRNDLMTIIQNIGASPAELAQGRTILQAALNLINALPADGTSRPTHRRNHQPPAHQFQIKRHETLRAAPRSPHPQSSPSKISCGRQTEGRPGPSRAEHPTDPS